MSRQEKHYQEATLDAILDGQQKFLISPAFDVFIDRAGIFLCAFAVLYFGLHLFAWAVR